MLQCANLVVLDLSRCAIQSRGLGRLLHALRIARISGLTRLLLRGNNINCRGVEHLGAALASGSFNQLRELDLRGVYLLCIPITHMFWNIQLTIASENELGDDGAGAFAHIAITGRLFYLEAVFLQRNMIHNVGFVKLCTILKSVYEDKCPNIVFYLQENLVTTACRWQHLPLPPCLGV